MYVGLYLQVYKALKGGPGLLTAITLCLLTPYLLAYLLYLVALAVGSDCLESDIPCSFIAVCVSMCESVCVCLCWDFISFVQTTSVSGGSVFSTLADCLS